MKIFPVPHTVKGKRFPNAIDGFLPSQVVVPLKQEHDCLCKSCVSVGERVTEGQVIAVPYNGMDFQAVIHAPIPGVVESIIPSDLPDGKRYTGIKIKMSGSFSFWGKKKEKREWKRKLPISLLEKFAEKGIVNTFSSSMPTSLAHEISKDHLKKNRLLIVRLFDEAPGLRVADAILYKTFYETVLEGIMITAHAMNAIGIVMLYDNQSEKPVVDADIADSAIPVATVPIDTRNYFSRFRTDLAYEVVSDLKEEPFSLADENDIFVDTQTMIFVANAVLYDTPVVRKYIFLEGDCIPSHALVSVPIGTSINDIVTQCGGLLREPRAIIINGVMTGTSAHNIDTPITKEVKSISFLSSSRVYDEIESDCSGCGNCRSACPYSLSPDILYEHAVGMRKAEAIFLESARLCSLCNMCNAVCPARLPISQTIANLVRSSKEMRYEKKYAAQGNIL